MAESGPRFFTTADGTYVSLAEWQGHGRRMEAALRRVELGLALWRAADREQAAGSDEVPEIPSETRRELEELKQQITRRMAEYGALRRVEDLAGRKS